MKIYPIFIPFSGCDTRCIYCQQELITRTTKVDIDKLIPQIERFIENNQYHDKEIAFFGGSFTLLPEGEQIELLEKITRFIPYLTGIRISTRPDGIDNKILDLCQAYSIKTIELGIQSFSDEVLCATKRSYMSKEAIDSCQLIKSRGFKLGIQLMPGLPNDTHQSWNKTIEVTLKLRPDFIRIYPTLVLKGTELEREYIEGRYKPLSLARAIVLTSKAYLTFTKVGLKVIKMGLHSDVSAEKDQVVAGPYHPAFAEMVFRHVLYRRIIDNYTPGFTVRLSNKDKSLIYGNDGSMYRKLERNLGISLSEIEFDEGLGKLSVHKEGR